MIMWPLILVATIAAASQDVIMNGGFESAAGDKPAQWLVYVEPMEGANAALDDAVHRSGGHSVRLHNPRPYNIEPANNWSQNLVRNLAGHTLDLSGYIKTENATEASIWIQCFSQQPWRIVRQVSTAYDHFVGGTLDWTEVKVSTQVPEGTDFVVVRCVLKGEGTAWFDDIAMTATPPASPVVAEPLPADQVPLPTEPVIPKVPEPPVDKPDEMAPPAPGISEQDKATLDALQSMREAGESLKESNDAIMDEIRRIREEMQQLQTDIIEKQQELRALQEAAQQKAQPPAPPLVPRLQPDPSP